MCTISRFNTTRSAISIINICVYSHPFKIIRNKEHEGVEDLMWGNVRERLSESRDISYEQGFDGVFMKPH
jgi:hypothetical protein